jgi:hypothetical protein
MAALVDHVAILDVKFSAFVDAGRDPTRQQSKPCHRQLRYASIDGQQWRSWSAIGPRKRQITASSIRQLGAYRILAPRADHERVLTVPRVNR